MFVLDASAALEMLLKTPRSVRWADRVFGNELHAPHLLDVEAIHVLRRLTQLRTIPEAAAQAGLERLEALPVFRHPHWPLSARIWELRSSLSAYDATYVALSETLGIPLLTCDAKLARSHGHRAKIELLR